MNLISEPYPDSDTIYSFVQDLKMMDVTEKPQGIKIRIIDKDTVNNYDNGVRVCGCKLAVALALIYTCHVIAFKILA